MMERDKDRRMHENEISEIAIVATVPDLASSPTPIEVHSDGWHWVALRLLQYLLQFYYSTRARVRSQPPLPSH
jgi:hypothetical protein